MRKMTSTATVALSVIILLFGCKRGPQSCPTCKGTGKLTSSESLPLPYEIVNHSVLDRGFFNPDYVAKVGVRNNGDKDGTFKVYVDFIYNDIGEKTVNGDVFVRAHSIDSINIRYDADNVADEFRYRVEPPVVIQSKETICPTCQGKGVM